MSKRILIVTTGTYPHGMASTYRIHCYSKGLSQEGMTVEVLSAKSQNKYVGSTLNYRSEFEGVPYTILWNRGDFGWRWFGYLWGELKSYVLLLYCILASRKFDVLWLYGMGLIPRLLLIPILRLLGKKVILELNEYPYSTEGSKFTRITIVRKVMKWATLRCVLPQLDAVVVISENLMKVIRYYCRSVPVLKVPILVESNSLFPESDEAEDDRPHPHPYLFHAGSLTVQKDGIIKVVEAYAKAAIELNRSSIRLDLVLTNKTALPDVWKTIVRILKENELGDRLKITGYLTESQLRCFLRHASSLLINKPANFQNRYNFPTKLGDYLLSGRPVIVAADGIELNNFLSNNINSCIVPPDDVTRMHNALVNFCLNKEHADIVGMKGRQAALEYFDYRKNAVRIRQFISSIA